MPPFQLVISGTSALCAVFLYYVAFAASTGGAIFAITVATANAIAALLTGIVGFLNYLDKRRKRKLVKEPST